jgi:cytochrome c peroxidase
LAVPGRATPHHLDPARHAPAYTGRRLGRAALALAVTLTACDAPTDPVSELAPDRASAQRAAPVDPRVVALLGEQIFNDRNLSLGRNQSCASCHDVNWGSPRRIPR